MLVKIHLSELFLDYYRVAPFYQVLEHESFHFVLQSFQILCNTNVHSKNGQPLICLCFCSFQLYSNIVKFVLNKTFIEFMVLGLPWLARFCFTFNYYLTPYFTQPILSPSNRKHASLPLKVYFVKHNLNFKHQHKAIIINIKITESNTGKHQKHKQFKVLGSMLKFKFFGTV